MLESSTPRSLRGARPRRVAALLARRTSRAARSAARGRGGASALPAHVLAALCLLCIVAAGCTGTTGHLAAVSTRDVDLTAVGDAPARHMIGRSCINLIIVVPTGMPNFGAAISDALQRGHGQVLRDATIRYELRYIPFVYGFACYVAEGDVQ